LPPLTWTGEKLQAAWIRKVLAGELPSRTRPWKKSHMPAFPIYSEILSQGLAAQHGLTEETDSPRDVDPAQVAAGKLLIEKERGFHCLQCHGLAGQPPEAPFESRGIDFPMIRARMRPEFYQRWIGNPIQFDPSVPMPRFSPDGQTTPVTTILDGQARPQFDAIWQYLQSLGDTPH
jgi:mono/diheme cytochrome c family protein